MYSSTNASSLRASAYKTMEALLLSNVGATAYSVARNIAPQIMSVNCAEFLPHFLKTKMKLFAMNTRPNYLVAPRQPRRGTQMNGLNGYIAHPEELIQVPRNINAFRYARKAIFRLKTQKCRRKGKKKGERKCLRGMTYTK